MLNCEYTGPVYWDNELLMMYPVDSSIKTDKNWAFSKMNCQGSLDFSTSTLPINIEKIVSQDQEREFFIEKNISYGDFLMIAFFIIFFVGFSVMGIRDFVKNRKLERL